MRAAQFLAIIGRGSKGSNALENTEDRAGATSEQQDNVINTVNSLDPYGPSWQLVPTLMKEDVVPALIPTNGLGDLTFTRASDATRTNSAGVIERAPWNLVTWSEMFSDASWTKTNLTVGVNTINSPIGTLTADTLTENTANATHELRTNTITPPVGSINLSVYGKMKERRYLRVGLTVAWGASLGYVVFDLQTGTITYTGGAIVGTIENAGDGWYRCSVRGTVTSSVSGTAYIGINADSTTATTYLGNGTSGIYLWGAQLVEGTDAKPYFATTNRQDVPRLDYRNADGSVSTCPRLLLEPQRTNLLTFSEQFNDASWIGPGRTITPNSAISPDGYQNADNVEITSFSASVPTLTKSSVNVTAQTTYTLSFYAKSNDLSELNLAIYNLNTATFILINQVRAITSDWSRVILTFTTPVGCTSIRPFIIYGATSLGSFDLWGAQLEAGAYPTTYIPTTTAAVTRLADAASKTGVSSLIGQTEGTLFVDFINGINDSANYLFTVCDNSSSNRIGFSRNGSFQIATTVNTAGVGQGTINTTTLTANARYKAAIVYSTDNVSLWVNGSLIGTDTTAAIPATSAIRLDNGAGIAPWHLNTNEAAFFTRRLTNAELAEITTL